MTTDADLEDEQGREIFRRIPNDVTPDVRRYMQAQAVIQSLFYSFGDRQIKDGAATLRMDDLCEVLNIAQAMILHLDKSLETSRDVRVEVENQAKITRRYVEALRLSDDPQLENVLAMMGMSISQLN